MEPHTSPSAASTCLVCGSSRLHIFSRSPGSRVVRCDDCLLMLRDPRTLGDEPIATRENPASAENVSATASQSLDLLARYRGQTGGTLLGIERGGADFVAQAKASGLDPTALDYTSPPVWTPCRTGALT